MTSKGTSFTNLQSINCHCAGEMEILLVTSLACRRIELAASSEGRGSLGKWATGESCQHQWVDGGVAGPKAASSFPALSWSTEESSCPFSLSFRIHNQRFHLPSAALPEQTAMNTNTGSRAALKRFNCCFHMSQPFMSPQLFLSHSGLCLLSKETGDCIGGVPVGWDSALLSIPQLCWLCCSISVVFCNSIRGTSQYPLQLRLRKPITSVGLFQE